ncbi:MAG: type I-U CRISPR-associated protein Csb2 [Syntrophobacteraceae bacterium]
MFGLGIRYLMGWAMAAADGARKEKAEWPPHPDRVFMALAAGWFETGQNEMEGAALRWLESLSAPSLSVHPGKSRHAEKEDVPTVSYVPVNDTRCSLRLLTGPGNRPLQPRAFPVTVLNNPFVYLSWPDDLPEIYQEPIATLCRKVVSIGHSASLVQMWIADKPPPANLIPVIGQANHRLRIPAQGRLEYLETRCNRQAVVLWADMQSHILNSENKKDKKKLQSEQKAAFPDGKPASLRPEPGHWQGYGEPDSTHSTAFPCSLFDPRIIVLSLSGKKLSLSGTLKLTEALRGALLNKCPKPVPEWISGHASNGSRTSKPHLALLPLPFVGSAHADGHLMGVGLAIPRDIDPTESSRILGPGLLSEHGLPKKIRLFDGKWFECVVEFDLRESPPWNLRPGTWTGPARVWSTVTPIVLDRHFDGKNKWEKAAESLKDCCERIGLPRPLETLLHMVSMFEGVPRGNEFPLMTRKQDNGRMHHTHAVLLFEQEVQGPVIIGAGRFRGYGLCRPVMQGGGDVA